MLAALAAAFSLLAPSAAAALEDGASDAPGSAVARVVEIRVSGDAAALGRVRITARELLMRLDVQPNVKAIDEPETSQSELTPLVLAYVDLRNLASPSIEIEDGKTHEQLTSRNLSDVTSLETGVEAVLHVLYLSVESMLQVGAATPPAPPLPPTSKKPKPPSERRVRPEPSHFGFDVGPLLRLSTLGNARVVPGGGIALEPRADFGRAQASLLVSGVMHGSSELGFEHGEAELRPLQIRVIPTLDWLLSPDVSGCLGIGGGLDSLLVHAVQPPEVGLAAGDQSSLDPIVTGSIGARAPISGRLFLAAMASLDVDLAPTSFVAHEGMFTHSILRLPRVRGGFTLALSFTAAGERRFAKAGAQ
jgi:hypothetical protein